MKTNCLPFVKVSHNFHTIEVKQSVTIMNMKWDTKSHDISVKRDWHYTIKPKEQNQINNEYNACSNLDNNENEIVN